MKHMYRICAYLSLTLFIFLGGFSGLPFISAAVVPAVSGGDVIVGTAISNPSYATGTCSGELRTDLVAAQDCANKAETQLQSRGYAGSCYVVSSGLAGFTDPTSAKTYILNTLCTIAGSGENFGAMDLVGFDAAPSSTALIKHLNPGWDALPGFLTKDNAIEACLNGLNGDQSSSQYGDARSKCLSANLVTTPVFTTASTSGGVTKPGNTSTGSGTPGESAADEAIASPQQASVDVQKKLFSMMQGLTSSFVQKFITGSFTPSTTASSNNSPTPSTVSLTADMKLGDCDCATIPSADKKGQVALLTSVLTAEGFMTAPRSLFDTVVSSAVIAYQEAHAVDILTPLGLTHGTGIVGASTRAYMNAHMPKPVSTTQSIARCPAPTSARYIKVTGDAGIYSLSIRKIEAYDAAGNKVRIVASTASDSWGRNTPDHVYDNDLTSGWNANATKGFIVLDLGSAQSIVKVRIWTVNSPRTPVAQTYSVSTSLDGTNFAHFYDFAGAFADATWIDTCSTVSVSTPVVDASPSQPPVSSAAQTSCLFTTDLAIGASGNEVGQLTQILMNQGFLSKLQLTFDTIVSAAVTAYQEAHAASILTPLGLTHGTGIVGASTRAYMNANEKFSCI